jgi:hypothetical protein
LLLCPCVTRCSVVPRWGKVILLFWQGDWQPTAPRFLGRHRGV